MSKITQEVMQHVAKLAHLGPGETECAQYAKECSAILDFVDQLSEVDTENVVPMAHAVDLGTTWRPDEVCPSDQAEAIIQNGPSHEDRFFTVPKVIA